MPKAKSSSSRANARSSKKSAGKKGLLAKLNLTSKRNQFIAVILLVAVMGAGWFTYKSFAATPLSPSTIDNGRMRIRATRDCTGKSISDTAKNDIKVASLYCPGDAYEGRSAVVESRDGIHIWKNNLYRACATVRGSGKIEIGIGDSIFERRATYTLLNINTQSYQTHCSGFQQWKGDTMYDLLQVRIKTDFQNGRNALVNISKIWAEEKAPTEPCTGGKSC